MRTRHVLRSSDNGKLSLGNKSDFLTYLEEVSAAKSESPVATSVVLDGAAIIQMLKPAASKTFDDYARQIFIPYIASQYEKVTRLDLVWDSYIADSLKGTMREKHGKGVRRRVVAEAAIPPNWQNLLRVNENKTELFKFLSEALLSSFNRDEK